MRHKNIIFRKKGELTTQQIVMLIVLLASFVVLLVFLVKVNFQDTSEKEICQSSVQLMGKAKTGFFSSIDCKTHYLCISGGGECTGFTYKDTAKINLKDVEVAKKEIMKILADEMVDCWWMFGEGKIDYSGTAWIKGSAVCAVCTQFAFDEKLKTSKIVISSKDICDFLKTAKRNDKQTYSEYLGLGASYPCSSIDFTKKYSVYTGSSKSSLISDAFSWIIPGRVVKDSFVAPTILERDDSQSIRCSSFVTKPI